MFTTIRKKRYCYGDFGNLSQQYSQSRQGFPLESIDYLRSRILVPRPLIVDLGCGTGISTRQLADREARVIGIDRDQKMIARAEAIPSDRITYVLASSDSLPFPDEMFDIATAFSSFHWFTDKNSLREIQRILKPNGIFFVVNKNDVGDFRDGYRAILNGFIRRGNMPDVKKNYRPNETLQAYFANIEERVFTTKETFSFHQAVTYLQSVSLWNLVPAEKKSDALKALDEFCKHRITSGGFVERKIEVTAVLGQKQTDN